MRDEALTAYAAIKRGAVREALPFLEQTGARLNPEKDRALACAYWH